MNRGFKNSRLQRDVNVLKDKITVFTPKLPDVISVSLVIVYVGYCIKLHYSNITPCLKMSKKVIKNNSWIFFIWKLRVKRFFLHPSFLKISHVFCKL